MLDLAKNGFTREQVIATLHSPSLTYDFRYELLDGMGNRKGDLKNVISASIDHDVASEIKRTARFLIAEDDALPIDYLNDRIRPYMRIKIPKGRVLAREFSFFSHIQNIELESLASAQAEGWVEYPLGIFLLASPTRKDDGTTVIRDVEAYDGLIILRQDKFTERYTILEGTSHYDAIVDILTSSGIKLYNIDQSDTALTRSIEYEPGTTKLSAINDLLSQINFVQIQVDVEGYYTSFAYRPASERAIDYSYIDDELSITFANAEEELDLFNIPNVFTVVRTNGEEPPITASFINSSPNSPTSTVSRGRPIVDVREVSDIADQYSLNNYIRRVAFEESQVYGNIRFNTQLMPTHAYADVLRVVYSRLSVDGKYEELRWSMDLRVGGTMTHEVRQVVDVGGVVT